MPNFVIFFPFFFSSFFSSHFPPFLIFSFIVFDGWSVLGEERKRCVYLGDESRSCAQHVSTFPRLVMSSPTCGRDMTIHPNRLRRSLVNTKGGHHTHKFGVLIDYTICHIVLVCIRFWERYQFSLFIFYFLLFLKAEMVPFFDEIWASGSQPLHKECGREMSLYPNKFKRSLVGTERWASYT